MPLSKKDNRSLSADDLGLRFPRLYYKLLSDGCPFFCSGDEVRAAD